MPTLIFCKFDKDGPIDVYYGHQTDYPHSIYCPKCLDNYRLHKIHVIREYKRGRKNKRWRGNGRPLKEVSFKHVAIHSMQRRLLEDMRGMGYNTTPKPLERSNV